ncbi:hypothetical protein AAHZ94_27355 [Streptomyces sp. HSW2009]|uniref:hypothetical protein n=1 Tax=Streptomyces sp. HSW2009 TaxID=3142890 RepID=UPI0032ECAE6E
MRVPKRASGGWIFAPCAYFPTSSSTGSYQDLGSAVYEDAELQKLLCALDGPFDCDEKVYRVRDAQGETIGLIRRIPPINPFVMHTWRIEQPGRPVIFGRNKWSQNNFKEMAWVVLESAVGFLARSSEDGSYLRDRELAWRTAEGKFVMKSCGFGGHDMRLEIEIEARWLDRRLAFAYAMLRDGPAI